LKPPSRNAWGLFAFRVRRRRAGRGGAGPRFFDGDKGDEQDEETNVTFGSGLDGRRGFGGVLLV
jgi:hypothetical protein